jgi:hypothetical protein
MAGCEYDQIVSRCDLGIDQGAKLAQQMMATVLLGAVLERLRWWPQMNRRRCGFRQKLLPSSSHSVETDYNYPNKARKSVSM